MDRQLNDKESLLLSHIGKDGIAHGNKALRQALRWGEKQYFEVRRGLLEKGLIALGRGRGGSVRLVFGDDQALLALVPVDGSISNPKLIERLGWPHDRYWEVRNRLVEKGDLLTGKGRGGTVSRALHEPAEEDEENEEDEQKQDASARSGEGRLYEPLKRVLETDWAAEEGVLDPVVHISAHGGGKRTGGIWSRPDLIMVGRRSLDFLIPQHSLDVWTFEVKAEGWNMKAIHETNANGRHATRACALLQVTDDRPIDKEYDLEAKRIGVGLITFTDADKWDTWNTRVAPKIRLPKHPGKALDFLQKQIPADRIEHIKDLWHRRDRYADSKSADIPPNLRTRQGFNKATVKEVHAFYETGGTKAQLEAYWAERGRR